MRSPYYPEALLLGSHAPLQPLFSGEHVVRQDYGARAILLACVGQYQPPGNGMNKVL